MQFQTVAGSDNLFHAVRSKHVPNSRDLNKAVEVFNQEVMAAGNSDEVWRALQRLAATVGGFKLFTVMTVDMDANLARRAHSSHPDEYPVSGTKPIHRDQWFETVHGEKRSFVANTIGDIAKVFPDHEKIWSMGCGSVINLPVIIEGELVATINMLHRENYYSPQRVRLIEEHLSEPARRARDLARQPV
jgi:hypothetical protein